VRSTTRTRGSFTKYWEAFGGYFSTASGKRFPERRSYTLLHWLFLYDGLIIFQMTYAMGILSSYWCFSGCGRNTRIYVVPDLDTLLGTPRNDSENDTNQLLLDHAGEFGSVLTSVPWTICGCAAGCFPVQTVLASLYVLPGAIALLFTPIYDRIFDGYIDNETDSAQETSGK
jgi:hypothetical protein